MFNKSVQSNRTLLSGQLHRIILNKQTQRDEIDYVRRKNSLKQPLKEQINLQKSHNHFNARNSMDGLESVFRVETSKKIKSPIVVIPNRKLFVSSKNSRKSHQSASQEPGPLMPGVKKSLECGYRIVVNKSSRVPTIQMDEEVTKEESKIISSKDPVSFTDWVERIYGKEWFY
ncbi:unnamed protein product [Paramecium pentaurelia]|uniref:Uncharacterized protein n=1 Tax=Paramecium pentaurelia TaxID=43138 RepID=A0A8S1WJS1_9CILI|nr:unnamed protein product [Paramecium pentaurelia]